MPHVIGCVPRITNRKLGKVLTVEQKWHLCALIAKSYLVTGSLKIDEEKAKSLVGLVIFGGKSVFTIKRVWKQGIL